MKARAQVTTTTSIDGWMIDSYLGVVASHVVAGTGIGSDFLAGFSDFFGGRSGAYQKQLASIYAEAIDQLYRRSQQLGGNWIVGLRADIDEVSGKGTQMFMVTAIGTAVHASVERSKPASGPGVSAGVAAAVEVERMQRQLAIGRAAKANELTLDANTWEFIVDQKVEQAAPAVLNLLARVKGEQSWTHLQDPSKQKALTFFQALSPDSASHILHDALCDSPAVAGVALGVIRDLSLLNLRTALQGMRSTNLELRRRLVQALEGHQQSYLQEDLAVLDDIIVELSRAFQDGPDVVRGKSLLGGKKDRWICDICGHQNGLNDERCSKCTRDTHGFRPGEATPDKISSTLRERREALEALFVATQVSSTDGDGRENEVEFSSSGPRA